MVLKILFITLFVISSIGSYSINSQEVVIAMNQPPNMAYTIELVQTDKLKPPEPADEAFSIYTSKYYGEFQIRLMKNGKEVDTIDLNEFFERAYIGFIGDFQIEGQDVFGDNQVVYNIGIEGESPYFDYIIFTISEEDTFSILSTNEGMLKHVGKHHSELFALPFDGMITVTHYDDTEKHYYEQNYKWDGLMFLAE